MALIKNLVTSNTMRTLANVTPVKIGEITIMMTRTTMMVTNARNCIEKFEPRASWMTWMSEFMLLTIGNMTV